MNNTLLLSNRYKVFGWIIFLLSSGLHIAIAFLDMDIYKIPLPFETDEFTDGTINDEIILSFVLIGLLMIAFAKEKKEDEYISFLRLKSWQWAVLISYGILLLANWSIFGLEFLSFMTYNMFTVLIVFIIKFNYSLHQLRKGGDNEK